MKMSINDSGEEIESKVEKIIRSAARNHHKIFFDNGIMINISQVEVMVNGISDRIINLIEHRLRQKYDRNISLRRKIQSCS